MPFVSNRPILCDVLHQLTKRPLVRVATERGFICRRITLPDGSSRQFDHSISVHDVAADIGAGLAKAALAGKVDGQLVDTSFLIEHDAEVAIITAKNDEALELIRHDAAHVMAQAVQELSLIHI